MLRVLSRQVLLFLLAGVAQLLLDWTLFVLLTQAGLAVVAGNVLGRASGACLGYWLNGRYTFADGGQSRLAGVHLRRFVMAWLALTVLSTLLVAGIALRF